MLDACTRCGKCVEVCPSVKPAGITDATSEEIIGGVLDIVRSGSGPEASRRWAASCMLSGECIKACDYGVNPRFLLAMARVAIAKNSNELVERRRQGVDRYREISRDVTMLSRLQLDTEALERLGQKSASVSTPVEAPDFVFYTGCNVLKTPHIALLALDIMDVLGITYQVMGGPSHCCGISQLRAGDVEMAARMALELDREVIALQDWPGHILVPELPGSVQRNDAADDRTTARVATVRNDAVHAVPRGPPRSIEAALAATGRHAGRAAPAPGRGRRHGSRHQNSRGWSPVLNSLS